MLSGLRAGFRARPATRFQAGLALRAAAGGDFLLGVFKRALDGIAKLNGGNGDAGPDQGQDQGIFGGRGAGDILPERFQETSHDHVLLTRSRLGSLMKKRGEKLEDRKRGRPNSANYPIGCHAPGSAASRRSDTQARFVPETIVEGVLMDNQGVIEM